MKELNWHVFEALHSENPSKVFQDLSHELFCSEYKIDHTQVNRYIDNKFLEVLPVQIGSEWKSYQSKYRKGSLSDYKDELIKAIKHGASTYKNLTEILIYVKEFGQSSTKGQVKSQAELAIEDEAKLHGIKIAWRTDVNIFQQLKDPENSEIRKRYFGKGINDIAEMISVQGVEARANEERRQATEFMNRLFDAIDKFVERSNALKAAMEGTDGTKEQEARYNYWNAEASIKLLIEGSSYPEEDKKVWLRELDKAHPWDLKEIMQNNLKKKTNEQKEKDNG